MTKITIKAASRTLFAIETQVRWLNDPEVVKFSEQRHRKHTIETQFDYIAGFVPPNRLCEIHADGLLAGTLSVYIDQRNSVADIGILIGPKFWGMGIGGHAWKLAMAALFNEGIQKIEAGCMSTNLGMRKILNKTMRYEGERLLHFKTDLTGNRRVGMVFYGRSRDDNNSGNLIFTQADDPQLEAK